MNENQRAAGADDRTGNTRATTEGVDRLVAGARSGINAAAEAAHPTIDRVAAAAHHAVDSADEAADNAGAKGKEFYASGVDYMRDHPLFTIGVAVAGGYLLSRLLAKH